MVIYRNWKNTVRILKFFNDRNGEYCYYLEKLLPPITIFGFILFGSRWSNGSIPKCGISPIKTYDLKVVDSWIREYNLHLKNIFEGDC